MTVRILIGLLLAALGVVGGALLSYGIALDLYYSDASDPPSWSVGRSFWLAYLTALTCFWSLSAVSLLWPGQRSARLRRALNAGAVAVALSGAALVAVAHMLEAARFYMELAVLVLLSGLAGWFGQVWMSREADAR